MLIVALALVVLAALVLRQRRARIMRDITTSHRTLGPDGIVIGGEGFTLDAPGAPAVLLLHGGGDTPQTMRYLGDALRARGFHVEAPLLPGHGRTLRDFARVTADDLTNAARARYDVLRRSHGTVAIVGLSMGGAIAVQLAAEHPEIPALVLLAPYLAMPARVLRAARWAWAWGPFLTAVRSGDGRSIRDPVERDRGLAYGVFTPAALRALRETVRRANAALSRVQAPTLVVNSRGDNRIHVNDAQRAFERLGARDKQLEWITGAGHVITVDYGRDVVIAATANWIERWIRS
ncbi:MAG TPA: alpha/beta fold hydrolase [Gemmatimonadaceae bacterium]|nr:alpha/beta fold hydrolase [Gemmatimonadaceae bacterium]